MAYPLSQLIARYPCLASIQDSIDQAGIALEECYSSNGKLLVCGNGGSAADADHIAGELMKSFKASRPLPIELQEKLKALDEEWGKVLAENLQQGLKVIALHNHPGLNSAIINDIPHGAELSYAQQVNVYGEANDVFLGISTSGNAKNVYNAALLAKAKGLKVIALTGASGGRLAKIADIAIKAPETETFMVQELHLPIYHYLCLRLEERFFAN